MFSKNKKWMALILPLVTAILLFLSCFAYRKAEENSQTAEHMYAVQPTTEPTTMEMRTTEAVSDGDVNGVAAEANAPSYAAAVQEYNVAQEDLKKVQTDARNYRIVFVCALIVGIAAWIGSFVVLHRYPVILGVELDVLVVTMAVYQVITWDVTAWISWVILFLLLWMSVYAWHDLVTWVRHGFSTDASVAFRIADTLKKRTGHGYVFLVFAGGWFTVCTIAFSLMVNRAAHNWILTSAYFRMAMIMCGFCMLTALLAVIRYVRAVAHMENQIGRLHQGMEPELRKDIYADTEWMLADLKHARDQAINQAVVSERFKVDLITNVSHDLRTPLTSILGYGELLCAETLSKDGQAWLAQLNGKAGYMRDLVDELFELTKISSGALKAKREKIDLIKLLEQTIGLLSDKLQAQELTVKRHYSAEHVEIQSDGAMLHQVFVNLVGNAIKYSPAHARIHIRVTESESDVTVRMSNVASYEMNFTPEEIVQRFARGDKARSTKGSGLGLAIAQTYTDAVGGTFHIEIDDEQFVAVVEIPKQRSEQTASQKLKEN